MTRASQPGLWLALDGSLALAKGYMPTPRFFISLARNEEDILKTVDILDRAIPRVLGPDEPHRLTPNLALAARESPYREGGTLLVSSRKCRQDYVAEAVAHHIETTSHNVNRWKSSRNTA